MNSYSNIYMPKSEKHCPKIRIPLEPQAYGKPYNIVPDQSGLPSKNQDYMNPFPCHI